MHTHRLLPLVILAATFTLGCDPELVDADPGLVSLRPEGGGGVYLNTSSIGSKEFSEFDLNHQLHDGVILTGVFVKNASEQLVAADTTDVVDGQLRAKVGAAAYTGAALIGSRWDLTIPDYDYNHDDGDLGGSHDDNGVRNVELWVSGHTQVSAQEGHYTFVTLDAEDVPTYVCDADGDGHHAAIPIKGVSVHRDTGDMTARADTVYLACTSGAVGKAVLWGYKPWERLLAEFEVASRMVRADYCFDGVSWTTNGTALQIRDIFDINDFLYEEDPTEVVWTADGVVCIDQPRNAAYTAPQVTCDGQALPLCPNDLSLASYPDALYWTKVDVL